MPDNMCGVISWLLIISECWQSDKFYTLLFILDQNRYLLLSSHGPLIIAQLSWSPRTRREDRRMTGSAYQAMDVVSVCESYLQRRVQRGDGSRILTPPKAGG